MKKPTLCLIFGGKSNEYEVSLRSTYNILSALKKESYELVLIGITKLGEWYLFEGEDEEILNDTWQKSVVLPVTFDLSSGQLFVLDKHMYAVNTDLIFPVMHGEYAEDGRLQGLFETAGVKCVGNGAFTSHICMDKALTKDVARSLSIHVAKSLLIKKNNRGSGCKSVDSFIFKGKECTYGEILEGLNRADLGFPLFVKPTTCGSSVGISLVNGKEELLNGINEALRFSDSVLVEEYVTGDEVEVGVLEKDGEIMVSCSGTIKHKGKFYDYQTKYEDKRTEYIIPSRIREKAEKYARECAKMMFLQLGCRGLCRFDFFVLGDKVVFNEANTMPGFTESSMFAMLFEKSGIDNKTVVDILINNCLGKSFE